MRSKLPFLVVSLMILSIHLSAQDLMYKSNGEKVKVEVLNKTRLSLTYRMPGTKDSSLYYISTTVLDSVIFGNASKELYAFHRKSEPIPEAIQIPGCGRQLIGTDVASFAFYKSLAFSYEYFIWKRSLGVKALLGFSLFEKEYYDNKWYALASQKGQYARVGLNYYFFPPGSFRIGTGLYFIGGNYKVHGEQYINNPDPPYETIIQKVSEVRKYRNFGLTLFVFYHITKNLAVNAGIDFPNYSLQESNSVFRSEVLLNF